MHPEDLESRGLTDGTPVTVSSRVGEVVVEVRATEDMMRGVVSLPHGYGHGAEGIRLRHAGSVPGVSINDLTDPAVLDVSGNAVLNGVPVTVSFGLIRRGRPDRGVCAGRCFAILTSCRPRCSPRPSQHCRLTAATSSRPVWSDGCPISRPPWCRCTTIRVRCATGWWPSPRPRSRHAPRSSRRWTCDARWRPTGSSNRTWSAMRRTPTASRAPSPGWPSARPTSRTSASATCT